MATIKMTIFLGVYSKKKICLLLFDSSILINNYHKTFKNIFWMTEFLQREKQTDRRPSYFFIYLNLTVGKGKSRLQLLIWVFKKWGEEVNFSSVNFEKKIDKNLSGTYKDLDCKDKPYGSRGYRNLSVHTHRSCYFNIRIIIA